MRLLDSPLAQRALAVLDVSSWLLAILVLLVGRYDFALAPAQWSSVLWYASIAAVLQLTVGLGMRLYRGVGHIGSFSEATVAARVVAVVGLLVGLLSLLSSRDLPRGVVVSVPLGALALMGAVRIAARAMVARSLRLQRQASREDVLIYGAGNAGRQLAHLIFSDPDAPYHVLGLIDDDRSKRHLRFDFGRVLGDRSMLLSLTEKLGVSTVILAIPSAPPTFLKRVSDDLERANLKLLVLPPVRDIVGGRVQLNQLREFDVTDMLGRDPIDTDLEAVAGYLRNKVVLVTGAGGSIGSEIARQVHRFGPKELICLDRDESGLHAVQLSIYGTALLDSTDMALCDIRDRDALERIFRTHRPDVVFHAAALKHLPMLESYPDEGWKTNVLGTLNVLECATAAGVSCFVNISTDKAADATSVLGRTKRKAEQLTSWFAEDGERRYLSVRFGNVLGSRGSVLHTFRAQIRRGGPVTVVDPDITRFFMTIPEACQLVIQAGAIGEPAAVLVLDMGKPVRIVDVAKRMIKESGEKIEIIYTGLRRGEKMHEVLFSEAEESIPTQHPLIARVQVPAVDPDEIRSLSAMPSASRVLSVVGGTDHSPEVRLMAKATPA
ncbi:polysaccharide biosynthesis protein [Micropruina sp.]|uniref:polysaccharide biosynthesis protein n=1 Tax=Micropruina sp. TaxID=2737536 RepID=UPI0039E4B6F7